MGNVVSLDKVKNNQFSEHYPASIRSKMLEVTTGKYDFLFLDFLINNAYLQKTDEPIVNIGEFNNQYNISGGLIAYHIKKLTANKVIILKEELYRAGGHKDTRWYVPLVSSELNNNQTKKEAL